MGLRNWYLRGLAIIQPDVTIAVEFWKAEDCSMAEAFSVRCIPHIGGLTAVGIAANLHLALAHRNAKLLEIDPWEYQPLRDDF
jgi:L-alanine-DL-glutamate epimerase-like enolase superfamily enzyme